MFEKREKGNILATKTPLLYLGAVRVFCILFFVVVGCSFYSFELNLGTLDSKWAVFELCRY
jgi:hypothetical protein